MKKNKILTLLLLVCFALVFSMCDKDDDNTTEDPPTPTDPKEYLWGKWWYHDAQTNVYFAADGTCKYFDNTFEGNWNWINNSDTMQITGVTSPVSWKMYFILINEHSFITKYDNDNFTESFTFTDSE